VAGELAGAGLDVVVLEAGGHPEAADFPADELSAFRELYRRGGLNLTEEGNVAILAGATLGGGSTINRQNCVRPPHAVRESWATEHGLAGVDGAGDDEHLDAALERISATSDCTDLNGVHQRLAAAADPRVDVASVGPRHRIGHLRPHDGRARATCGSTGPDDTGVHDEDLQAWWGPAGHHRRRAPGGRLPLWLPRRDGARAARDHGRRDPLALGPRPQADDGPLLAARHVHRGRP
jgi:choline dehydrogenase-like flavoprotein